MNIKNISIKKIVELTMFGEYEVELCDSGRNKIESFMQMNRIERGSRNPYFYFKQAKENLKKGDLYVYFKILKNHGVVGAGLKLNKTDFEINKVVKKERLELTFEGRKKIRCFLENKAHGWVLKFKPKYYEQANIRARSNPQNMYILLQAACSKSGHDERLDLDVSDFEMRLPE